MRRRERLTQNGFVVEGGCFKKKKPLCEITVKSGIRILPFCSVRHHEECSAPADCLQYYLLLVCLFFRLSLRHLLKEKLN